MTGRQRLAAAGAALAFLAGCTTAALAATQDSRATCTPDPVVTGDGGGTVAFDVHCSVPVPTTTQTVTETATVTQTVTAAPPSTTTTTTSPSSTTTATPSSTATTTTATPTPTTSTTTPTTGCMATPSACGYPDGTNTGPTPGVTLAPSGSVTVRTNNAVVQNLDISGRLNIEATGVVVRNVKVHTSALEEWAVIVRDNASASFQNVEVYGLDKGTRHVQYAILSQTDLPVSIDRANLHHCADCVQGERVTLTNSWIHDLSNPPGSHVDGFQCNSYCNVTIRHNTIRLDYTQTGAISLFADFGTPRDSVVADNLLAGGGYTLYLGNRSATGIKVTGNRFSTAVWPGCGYWGIATEWAPRNTGNVWSGNVWDHSGAPANP